MDTENQSVCANTPDENHNKKSAKTKRGKNREKKRSFAEISSDGPGESNSTTEMQLTENALCTKSAEIEEFVVLMKKEVKEFSEYLDQIAMFINLHVPKVEDGNNFGVQVQDEMKTMVNRGQLSCQDFLRGIPKFHSLRAKIVSKILKYPNMMDYQKALIELDYKQLLQFKHNLLDLRNNYWILYDILLKNWDKIVKPKGDRTNLSTMY